MLLTRTILNCENFVLISYFSILEFKTDIRFCLKSDVRSSYHNFGISDYNKTVKQPVTSKIM